MHTRYTLLLSPTDRLLPSASVLYQHTTPRWHIAFTSLSTLPFSLPFPPPSFDHFPAWPLLPPLIYLSIPSLLQCSPL
uniref:Uncharacterized protein n=1 Tax=Arundo donax TaxID=35708 RepID=A0A0A8XYF7_ARUDO